MTYARKRQLRKLRTPLLAATLAATGIPPILRQARPAGGSTAQPPADTTPAAMGIPSTLKQARPADDSTRALARELFGIADRIDGLTDDPRMRNESAALRSAALLAAEAVLAR